MPKVTLDKVLVGELEVTLPTKCRNPECGADFTDEAAMNLIEHQYVSEDRVCFIGGTDQKGNADIEYGEVLVAGETVMHTTGYACRLCKSIIVSMERGL